MCRLCAGYSFRFSFYKIFPTNSGHLSASLVDNFCKITNLCLCIRLNPLIAKPSISEQAGGFNPASLCALWQYHTRLLWCYTVRDHLVVKLTAAVYQVFVVFIPKVRVLVYTSTALLDATLWFTTPVSRVKHRRLITNVPAALLIPSKAYRVTIPLTCHKHRRCDTKL